MQDFTGLPDTLSKALENKGYKSLTPVQQAVSDNALTGQDLLVSAQTGSGKTVGFGFSGGFFSVSTGGGDGGVGITGGLGSF